MGDRPRATFLQPNPSLPLNRLERNRALLKKTDRLPLYSALGPLPCNMLRLRGMVAVATRLQAAWQLWRQRWAAHLIQWCWKAVRRLYAAWTQAARVGATAGRAGAAEAAEAAEAAAEAAAEEEELLLGCI